MKTQPIELREKKLMKNLLVYHCNLIAISN